MYTNKDCDMYWSNLKNYYVIMIRWNKRSNLKKERKIIDPRQMCVRYVFVGPRLICPDFIESTHAEFYNKVKEGNKVLLENLQVLLDSLQVLLESSQVLLEIKIILLARKHELI